MPVRTDGAPLSVDWTLAPPRNEGISTADGKNAQQEHVVGSEEGSMEEKEVVVGGSTQTSTKIPPTLLVRLMREQHVSYLLSGLNGLGPGYVSLDASRPWLAYWISNALVSLSVDCRQGYSFLSD
jgi:hypothetical protein